MEKPQDKTSGIPSDYFFTYIHFELKTNTPLLQYSIIPFLFLTAEPIISDNAQRTWIFILN